MRPYGLVAAVVAVLVIAGCGSASGGSPPVTKTVTTTSTLTVTSTTATNGSASTSTTSTTSSKAAQSSGSGAVLYRADWSKGMAGWTGLSEWKTSNGHLLSDGSNGNVDSPLVTAPFAPPTPNYAIQASIQIIGMHDGFCYFGIFGRGQTVSGKDDGYVVGYHGQDVVADTLGGFGGNTFAKQIFTPRGRQIFRAEFHGNQIALKIDGHSIFSTEDNRFLQGTKIGLVSGFCQIDVASYEVLAL